MIKYSQDTRKYKQAETLTYKRDPLQKEKISKWIRMLLMPNEYYMTPK